jgi:hypothetical protein
LIFSIYKLQGSLDQKDMILKLINTENQKSEGQNVWRVGYLLRLIYNSIYTLRWTLTRHQKKIKNEKMSIFYVNKYRYWNILPIFNIHNPL